MFFRSLIFKKDKGERLRVFVQIPPDQLCVETVQSDIITLYFGNYLSKVSFMINSYSLVLRLEELVLVSTARLDFWLTARMLKETKREN